MVDIEKLENCPLCGKNLSQGEYDGQHCVSCRTNMGFRVSGSRLDIVESLVKVLRSIELNCDATNSGTDPRAAIHQIKQKARDAIKSAGGI